MTRCLEEPVDRLAFGTTDRSRRYVTELYRGAHKPFLLLLREAIALAPEQDHVAAAVVAAPPVDPADFALLCKGGFQD